MRLINTNRRDPGEILDIAVTDDEREALGLALKQYGGPAHATDAMAKAMGFSGSRGLPFECELVREALRRNEPLTRLNWTRALIVFEVVFASDIMGAGVEWSTVTGWTDESTVSVLRSLQRRLVGIRVPLDGEI